MEKKNKKPPIGLYPRKLFEERIIVERYNDVCSAISRYYDEGYRLPIHWIEEYNELVEKDVIKNYHMDIRKTSIR